jgi:hypothetical protein
MSYKALFVINAIIALAAGLVFLFVPHIGLDYFKTEGRAPEVFIARFFGMTSLVLGLVLWFAKDIAEANSQKGMGIALFVGALAGLVLSLFGLPPNGIVRVNGWIPVVVFGLGVLFYGFMLFLKPRMK